MNEEVFGGLKSDTEANHNLPKNLEQMRAEIRERTRPIQTNSGSRVLVENNLENSL